MWVKSVSQNMVLVTIAPATVTTTAARITAAPIKFDNGKGANQGITVQADPGNGSATIYVGDSTVTTSNGIALAAGSSFTFPAFDPYNVYAVASTGSQTLRIALV